MRYSQNQDVSQFLSECMSGGEKDNNKYACVNTKRKPPAMTQLIFTICSLLSKTRVYDITIH